MTANELLMLLGTKSLILFAAALIAWTLLFVTKVRTPLTHRIVWFSVLLLGIVGAGVPVTVFVETKVPEIQYSYQEPEVQRSETAGLHVPAVLPGSSVGVPTTLPALSVDILLPAVWFTVFVLLLLCRTVSYFVLLYRLQSAVPVNDEFYLTLLKNHRIRPGKLPLLLTTGIGPALVRRLTGSVIVIPLELWEEADNSIRRGIIEHEIAHYVQKDILVCGLARLTAAVHWFNPAAWFAVQKFEEATEWACDAAAFGNQESGERCLSESLLIMHETMPSIVLNRFSFGGGKLTRRVSVLRSILIQPKESVMKKFFVFGILVLVLAAGTVSVRIAAQEKVQEKPGDPFGVPATLTAQEMVQQKKPGDPFGVPATPPAPEIKQEGMAPWASYIIEPPDMLYIQVIHLVPKAPYRLRTFDVVAIDVTGLPQNDPINGQFSVEPGGKLVLGSSYGSVQVGGLTPEELEKVVVKYLTDTGKFKDPLTASVKLMRMTDMQQIEGKHLVTPDGFITLGSYGRVNVLGLTIPQCQIAIEEHLSHVLERPQVSVEVIEMNSKKYYVILKYSAGEQILTFTCAGNDTVLKAITDLKTIPGSLSKVGIQHIRPGKDDDDAKTTQLQWDKILLHRAGFGQNLQLLPGDRIIIEVAKPDKK